MSDEITFPDEPRPPRRPRWRLRVLVALVAGLLGLYGFARLDRSAAGWLGPIGVGAHDLISGTPPNAPDDSWAARRFKADVKALHATPSVAVLRPGFLGAFGRVEDFSVNAHDPAFDDAALAQLADRYGDRITSLMLQNTSITDAGLRTLARLPRLHQLTITHPQIRSRSGLVPPSRITDAGMAHLRGLDNLTFLILNFLPITDAGLAATRDLPNLRNVYLHGTEVQGRTLAGSRWLPRLSTLYLDETPFTEDGLRALQGATGLQILALGRVPLGPTAVPLLKALPPSLDELDVTGCGLLDEEVATLRRPGLKINRR